MLWKMPIPKFDPITRCLSLKHKKRFERARINKRLVSNGLRPKYKV